MKIKEEIEKLADDYAIGKSSSDVFKDAHKNDFIQGYTQCQEDMADEKYTEEDLRKAIEVGVNAEAGDYPKGFSHKLGISLEDYFINSLNKQD